MIEVDSSSLQVEDLKQVLSTLSLESSTPPEKILKKLLIFSSENGDAVSEMLNNGAVKVLSSLFSSTKLKKSEKTKIASVLILLTFTDEKSDENELSGIVASTLASVYKVSDFNVFLQSIVGIKEILLSSASPSSSSPLPTPPIGIHSLSISVCAILFEQITAALCSSTFSSASVSVSASASSSAFASVPLLRDEEKQKLLEALVDVVETGAMSEAIRFAVWCKSEEGKGSGGEGGGGGGSGGSGREGEAGKTNSYANRFSNAFEAFAKSLKVLWEGKRKSGLTILAKSLSSDIENKQFFPDVAIGVEGSDKSSLEKLPIKFVANQYANGLVTIASGKLTWVKEGWVTMALDEEIVKGIYKVDFECDGNLGGNTFFGISTRSTIFSYLNKQLYHDGCAIWSYGLYSGGNQILSQEFYTRNGKAALSLEVNADARSVHFIVNGKQIPHCFVNIPPSVLVYVSQYYRSIIEVKSFQRLLKPTINESLHCTQYQCK